jgi:hypothetical protein
MLDTLKEHEHASEKLQKKQVHHLIYLKYPMFQSITHNPGEYNDAAQILVNKLEFQVIKLEDYSKMPKKSVQVKQRKI